MRYAMRSVLLLLAAFLASAAYTGYFVGVAVDYVNGTGRVDYYFVFENGSAVPAAGSIPHWLVGTGEPVVVDGRLEDGSLYVTSVAGVEPLAAPPPQAPVRGPLLVTVVAAKFRDKAQEPFNNSYVHDVTLGPFPSMRDFWEYASGNVITLRPYYIHWGWLTLPRNRDDYCTSGYMNVEAVTQDVINLLYDKGVRLPDKSYLVITFNDQPSCERGVAGRGTIRFWSFNTPYGVRWLAVSWIYYYNVTLDVHTYAHEFGHNLGLHHSGTARDEYDDWWDVMGAWRARAWGDWWWGYDLYRLSPGLSLYHRYYLGWGNLAEWSAGRVYPVSGTFGGYLPLGSGIFLVPYYHCGGRYESYWGSGDYWKTSRSLPVCVVVLYKVSGSAVGRWVYLLNVYNSSALDSFLDAGLGAWAEGQRVYVLGRRPNVAYVVVDATTLRDVVKFGNFTFVVGARASAIDSVAAVELRRVLAPMRLGDYPVSAFLSDFSDMVWQIRDRLVFDYPGVYVAVGGPLANELTRRLNPPDSVDADGLPFYFSTADGGIKDARTGKVWRRSAAVIALVRDYSTAYSGGAALRYPRLYLLVWGLEGEDTRKAARWLAACDPPPARAVVINTTDFRILASWPSGYEGPSSCRVLVDNEVAVVGGGAASIDAVGAAIVAGGRGLLHYEVDAVDLPPVVYSVGGPLANPFTARYNPPDRPGINGLPFYYSTADGGIKDGRTGYVCRSKCFVVAMLTVDGRRVFLAWGLTGFDTKAVAVYLAKWKDWMRIFDNYAELVTWDYAYFYGYNTGYKFNTVADWFN